MLWLLRVRNYIENSFKILFKLVLRSGLSSIQKLHCSSRANFFDMYSNVAIFKIV